MDYSFPNDIYLSREAKDFITSMLQLEPSDRPRIEEILEFSFLQGEYPELCPPSSLYVQPENSELNVSIPYQDIERRQKAGADHSSEVNE